MRRRTVMRGARVVPPPSGNAAFPSRLRASGRTIVDANGATMPVMRGFNIHAVPFSQQTFTEIYTEGGRFLRIIARWDDFEPTAGNIVTAKRDALDLTISRASAAGLYCMIELHLISGGYPSWTTGTAEQNRYTSHGQYITQYLAYRYGNPSSPQYAVNCTGFGLNEPSVTVAEANAGTGNPFIENVQRQLITWMRAPGYASSWIGFVSYAYSQATPIRITGYNSSMVEASPTAFDSVGGNVVIDVHDYFLRDTRATAPYDGRQYNGMPYSQSNGGPGVGVGEEHYTTSALKKAQQAAFMAPYKTFCTSANLPLMVGEWGWVQVLWSDGTTPVTGEQAYIDDKQLVWDDSGAAFRLHWNYDTTTNVGLNPWAARPGGTWRISVDDEMGGPPPPPPAPPAGTIVNDTFSGGTDVAITAHTGETGATWTTGGVDRSGLKVNVTGRVYAERPAAANDDSWAFASGTPATAEYDATADIHVVSVVGQIGVAVGMHATDRTAYGVLYDSTTTIWTLYKIVANAWTSLGTYTGPITTGSSATVTLQRRSTGLTVFINGVSRITSADVAISAVGKPGIVSYGTWNSTTGVQLDNLVASNSAATIVNDTFSGGVDQYVTAHTGETGATWANITDRIGHRVSTAGRVYVTRPGGADDSWAYASGTPATAEYDVSADLYVVSTAAGNLGICAGMDTAAKTAYVVGYAAATGAWSLYKYVAGVSTTLGTFSGPITTGTSVTVILRRRATGLTVLIDGTTRITSADTAITAVGKAGLWSYGTWLSTTGVHADNFVATNA